MTFSEEVAGWNRWYDGIPAEWRFQVVLWPLIVIGALNMVLTIAGGFPFGLLVLLGVAFMAWVRVPYVIAKGKETALAHGSDPERKVEMVGSPWMFNLNRWYDGLTEVQRGLALSGTLVVAGAINMVLTINAGFPFGLLFLLVVLAIVAIRYPYTKGWLIPARAQATDFVGPRPEPQVADPVPPATADVAIPRRRATPKAEPFGGPETDPNVTG